jgi:hypothetical protein
VNGFSEVDSSHPELPIEPKLSHYSSSSEGSSFSAGVTTAAKVSARASPSSGHFEPVQVTDGMRRFLYRGFDRLGEANK